MTNGWKKLTEIRNEIHAKKWPKAKIMTYEEALALATKNMAPLGYFPWEIKDAALKMLGEECAKEYVKIYGEVK